MKRILAITFVVFFFPLNAFSTTELVIRSIRLKPLSRTEARLTVTLGSRASLVLYYDNVQPLRPDVLETFWFSEVSDERATTHSFLLRELEPGTRYYFRLASSWPGEFRSAVLQWMIPENGNDDIVIK